MVDTNYKKIEEGQMADVIYTGHRLRVEIYEVENEIAYFKTIDRQNGEPENGYFNRAECIRYLTIV